MTQTQRLCFHRVGKVGWVGAIAGILVATYPTVGRAQIAADGTLGTQVNGTAIAPCAGICTITGGTERGTNLYHSFREFSIPSGGIAWFNNASQIQNILTRVTGRSISRIDGLIAANGRANLFFLNPNGIIFGANAQLQIGGSFFATTATRFKFLDGSEFGVNQSQAPPLLMINVPVGLQWGSRPASITNAGNLVAGQNLTLAGGSVTSTGMLAAPAGDLLVTAIAGDAQIRQVYAQQATLLANQNLHLVDSQLHTTGNLSLLAGGTVWIRDSLTTPVQVQAGGDLTIVGKQGIDILALNHPGAALQSGGALRLISDGVISGDARFASNGPFSVLNLHGQPGQFVSLYDPIISVNGDAILGDYTGASLKVEATGNIQIGNVIITGPDIGLTGSDPDIPILTSGLALILRSGVPQLSNPPNFVGSPRYAILNLGTLGGNVSYAYDINNLGQVVGASNDATGNVRAFRTAPNAVINPLTDNLGTLGGLSSFGYDINDSGQVTGLAYDAVDNFRAFRTAPNAAINPLTDNLGTLTGQTIGGGVNNLGQVVGESTDAGGNLRAFRTAPNGGINPLTDNLGSLGGDRSSAQEINEAGQVAGTSTDAAGNSRAFRTAPNAAINPLTDNLGTLGGDISIASDMNDSGQVVGESTDAGGNLRAFRTAPNAAINPFTDNLGTLGGNDSTAIGINNAGQVVGRSTDAAGNYRAFFYDTGFMIDLNQRIPSDSGWTLVNAYAINDTGQIVGTGLIDGQGRAFLLNPLSGADSVGPGTLTVGTISPAIAAPLTVILSAKSNVQSGAMTTFGGNVAISSQTGTVNIGGFLDTTTFPGNGGSVTVTAAGDITTRAIDSGSYGNGRGGVLQLTSTGGAINTSETLRTDSALGGAGDLRLTAAGAITTDSLVAFAFGDETGGNITVNSGATFSPTAATIISGTAGRGNAGNITLWANAIAAINSLINSGTTGNGTAGTIAMAANRVDLLNATSVIAGTEGTGNGGTVWITARDRLTLAGVNAAGRPSEIVTDTLGSGRAGDIQITTANLVLLDGGIIASAVRPTGTGRGGNVQVNADVITLNGTSPDGLSPSRIVTATFNRGDAGDLTVNTRQLTVQNGALISTASLSANHNAGRSGNLTINATDILLSGTSPNGQVLSVLSADTFGPGAAGELRLATQRLTVRDGAAVSVSTFGTAQGGRMIVNARDRIDLSGSAANGFASGLYAQAFGSGNAGDLQVTTGQLTVRDRATITVASGSAADTRIPTGQPNFTIPASSSFPGNAGNIFIVADTLLLNRQGQLLASTAAGEGGNIDLMVSDLLVLRRNSLISATAGTAQAGGNGGNITMRAPFIIGVLSENSDITANAFSGRGGNITLNTNAIYGLKVQPQLTPRSDITASSQLGISGTITLNTLTVDPTNSLSALPTDFEDQSRRIQPGCMTNRQGSVGQFVAVGRGGLPPDPAEPLTADSILTANGQIIAPMNASRAGNAIGSATQPSASTPPSGEMVEANHWYISPDGTVLLVANLPGANYHQPSIHPLSCNDLLQPSR